MKKITDSEKVALSIYNQLSDVRIEGALVGRYFAQNAIPEVYEKFVEMAESAFTEKEDRIDWIKQMITGDDEYANDIREQSQYFN